MKKRNRKQLRKRIRKKYPKSFLQLSEQEHELLNDVLEHFRNKKPENWSEKMNLAKPFKA